MRHIIPVFLMALTACSAHAQQDTLYLDAQENVVKQNKAVSCLVLDESKKDRLTASFYTLDKKLLRTCEYKSFSKKASQRILHGATHYKFAGSMQDSLQVFYTNNVRNGSAVFYYPDGAIMAQGTYKNGMLNGLLQQFYEDGKTKRKEIYKEDVSQGGIYLSPDSTTLEFTPFYQKAAYPAGYEELCRLLGRNMMPDRKLVRYMAESNRFHLTADIGLVISPDGKAVGLSVLRSDDPKFNESSFEKILPVLSDKKFIPATLDGRPCYSVMRIDGLICEIRPSVRINH